MDLLRHIFPRKISPKYRPQNITPTPGVTIRGNGAIMGRMGRAPPFVLPLRRCAHPASPSLFRCSKRITHLLALNAQNRTSLQKTRFFCCKNYAVAASQTRSPTICSSVPYILPLRKLKKYQGHKGELTPRRSSQMTAPPLPAKVGRRQHPGDIGADLIFARTK